MSYCSYYYEKVFKIYEIHQVKLIILYRYFILLFFHYLKCVKIKRWIIYMYNET